jgi:hypothetical protein
MTRTAFVVVLLRVIFGVIAAIAALVLPFGSFIFDSPAATRNPLAWNLALAPIVYFALFAYSFTSSAKFFSFPRSGHSPIIRALMPALGILWFGLALLLLQLFCGGSFGCTAS